MRVAFDENVPPALVRVFQTFAREPAFQHLTQGLVIESARDYTPSPGDPDYQRKNDAPWIKRFAKAGGRVIISGNTAMKAVPHERLALVEAGMVVVFFEAGWNNLQFYTKCARLLQWWPVVAKTITKAKAPSFWHIPSVWEGDALRPVSHEDQKKLKLERQIAAKAAPVAPKKRKKPQKRKDPRQRELDLKGPGERSGKETAEADR